jgi:hypothetical protein
MKRIILLFLTFTIHFVNCQAQDCTDANVSSLPGKWKSIPGSFFNHSKEEVLKEKPLADAVVESIRKNFSWSVVGGVITYESCGFYTDPRPFPIVKICNLYSAGLYFNAYHCDAGKITIEEGLSALNIRFNDLPFDFGNSFYTPGPNATQSDTDPQTDVYATLKWLPEVIEGYFDYIQDNVDGTGNTAGKILRYRIITKPGKIPYTLMNKKEYYEKWKKKHLAVIKNIEGEKANLSKDLAGNAQLPALLQQHDQYIGLYQQYINKIDAILKTTAAKDLEHPAYEGEEEGAYFENLQASLYKAYIVKINYDYFDNKLSKTSPQIITIVQRYSMGQDDNGNRNYSDEAFYKALEKMNLFDLLTEKLKSQIVQ